MYAQISKEPFILFIPTADKKRKMDSFHQCSAVMPSCLTRAAGSGGCAGTGSWITTPCPSITSGEGCLETSTLHTNGTMAGSSSLKVRVRNDERGNETLNLLLKHLLITMCWSAQSCVRINGSNSSRAYLLERFASFLLLVQEQI